MKAALQQAIRGIEAQQSRCPACGSDQFHTQGTKRRVLLTRFGRVDVPLRRRRSPRLSPVISPRRALFG